MAIPGLSTIVKDVTSASKTIGDAVSKASGSLNSAGSQLTGKANAIKGAVTGGINGIAKKIRSINLPFNVGSTTSSSAQAEFGSSDVDNDWRVRLSIPPLPEFSESPVLEPLTKLGNMVFPYTPTIQLTHTANYSDVSMTHQNYQFIAYENSRVDNIVISAPFNVEDGQQAKYWIASLHYFRSITKMFTGPDKLAGNPPVIVKLNGYGEYVFNNVPVVVKSFSYDLPQDADYIPADENLLAGIPGLGTFLGAGVRASRVPTKSTLNVVLQPVYSRTASRNFSLSNFVNGGYVSNGGYV